MSASDAIDDASNRRRPRRRLPVAPGPVTDAGCSAGAPGLTTSGS